MFKKAISILAACAMFATMAMPVFAAGYGPYTTTAGGATLTFDKAKIEKRTIKIVTSSGEEESVIEDKEVTIVILEPGSKITVSNETSVHGTQKSETEDYYHAIGAVSFTVKTGLVDELFGGDYWKGKNIWISADNDVYLELGTGASAPATTPPAKGDTATPETAAPISFEDGTAYTVKAGDTLGLLSLNNYGSYNYWDELYTANAAVLKKSGGKIYKDLVINIPTTIAKGVTAVSPATAGEGEKLYTAQSGDTLGTIALAQYKDVSKYKAIFERNSDRLANANAIYAGQVIVITVA